MAKKERPIGIIRTIPSLFKDKAQIGAQRYRTSLRMLESGMIDAIYIALAQKPIHQVLHIYLLVDGKLDVRLNLAGFVKGEDAGDIKCWDEEYRQPAWWAICSGPVSRPPQAMPWRGFQGIRYVYEEIW